MVEGIPEMVLIDRKGIIRMVKAGNSPANVKALHGENRGTGQGEIAYRDVVVSRDAAGERVDDHALPLRGRG